MPGTEVFIKINSKSIPKLAFYRYILTTGIVAYYVKALTSALKLIQESQRVLSENIIYLNSYCISMLI